MTQWVTLSRAARLIGVSRAELQRAVREGRLECVEGTVPAEGLLALYPDLDLEDSGAFEHVTRVKEEAFGRRVLERVLPDRAVLAQRLYAQSRELADVRAHLQRYHELVVTLQDHVEFAARRAPMPALAELRDLLDRGLAEVLATESADPITIMEDMLKIVSAHVTVRPSGREFHVEGRDTLLQAGLKAGLKLNYGCGNGTCGLCKARVVSGEVTRVTACDYRLSEAERQQGYTLLCAHSAGSGDIVIETLEAAGPGEIPEQELPMRVRAVTPLADNTLLLHLQTPRSSRLRFLAGQSVTLFGSAGGNDAQGLYPVASCPCDDRNVHFHIPRDAHDAFAEMLFAGGLRAGDTLTLWGPTGEFVLADGDRPLAFVACDTGFAPVKSLIEHAMAVDATESISLDWLAVRPDGHYMANQCRAWAAAFDDFRFVPHAARDPVAGAASLVSSLARDVPLSERDLYVAGPRAFVAAALEALRDCGTPPARTFAATV